MVDAGRTDLIFVRLRFLFSGRRRCPRLPFCGIGMGDLQVYQTLRKRLPLKVPGFHLKMPRSGTPQDGQLSLRLASACGLQSIRVAFLVAVDQARAHARLPVLAAATWPCAWLLPCTVRRLDVAHFDCKGELGATKYGRSALPPHCLRPEGPRRTKYAI